MICLFFGEIAKNAWKMRFKQKRRIFMRLSTLKTDESFWLFLLSSDPAGTRTQDPNIKSVMLYQLSYEIVIPVLFKVVQI